MSVRRCYVADVRVVIVDDQEPYRRAMTAVVEETERFIVVASATSGEESLGAVARLRPDLVLMDVHLPGLDGIATSRLLTEAPYRPVVVLLSTYDEDQFDLADSGASSYVAKATFGPDRLSEAWENAVPTH
jgi:DNA-binding NarL/FixJ family response regulator